MTDVVLLPATVAHLEALQSDPVAFGQMIGGPVPAGWPQFGESIGFALDRLRAYPAEGEWWMHFFFSGDVLVGSGGYVGPPQRGEVEIGYELAPAFRGRGLGVAAARALVDKADAADGVTTVTAHTLAQDNPSTSVLRRLGFRWVGERDHPEEGTVWRWELALTAC